MPQTAARALYIALLGSGARTIFLLSLVLVSTSTWAQGQGRTIRIISDTWPNYIEQDGGYFPELARQVFEPYGYKVVAENRPFARVLLEVAEGTADIAPALYKNHVDTIIYAKKFTALDVTAMVFNTKSIPWVKGVESAAGKRVAWIRGFGYDQYLTEKFKISVNKIEVNSRESGLGMLREQRVDAFMDNAEGLEHATQAAGLRLPQYTTHTVFKKGLYFGFSNTERGRTLKRIFDAKLEKMIADGSLVQLYQRAVKNGPPLDYQSVKD